MMKWWVLLDLPRYTMVKQTLISRESKIVDPNFNMCDLDENYMPFSESSSTQ